MKKIPTLFEREFRGRKVVGITETVTPGLEWVLEGAGTATVKLDGSCCAIIMVCLAASALTQATLILRRRSESALPAVSTI